MTYLEQHATRILEKDGEVLYCYRKENLARIEHAIRMDKGMRDVIKVCDHKKAIELLKQWKDEPGTVIPLPSDAVIVLPADPKEAAEVTRQHLSLSGVRIEALLVGVKMSELLAKAYEELNHINQLYDECKTNTGREYLRGHSERLEWLIERLADND